MNALKYTICTLLTLIAVSSLQADSSSTLKYVHEETCEEYSKVVDEIITKFTKHGEPATLRDIKRMMLWEKEIMTNFNIDPTLMKDRPTLYISEGVISVDDLKSVAGQLITARLKESGVNPDEDNLENREFEINIEPPKTNIEPKKEEKGFLNSINPF